MTFSELKEGDYFHIINGKYRVTCIKRRHDVKPGFGTYTMEKNPQVEFAIHHSEEVVLDQGE